jgi:hypothetical protein
MDLSIPTLKLEIFLNLTLKIKPDPQKPILDSLSSQLALNRQRFKTATALKPLTL